MKRLSLSALAFIGCVLSANGADTNSLLKDLKAKDPVIRQEAIESLAKVRDDDKVTAALCDALFDTSPTVVKAALVSLEKVRPDLYKPLAAMLLDKSAKVRADAAAELGKLGEKAKPAVRVMTEFAIRESRGPLSRRVTEADNRGLAVIDAIRSIGIPDEETAKIMASFASQTNNKLCIMSMFTLLDWTQQEKENAILFATLKKWFADKQLNIQAEACRIAGKIGAPAKAEFGPTIERLKLSNNKSLREAAIEASQMLSK